MKWCFDMVLQSGNSSNSLCVCVLDEMKSLNIKTD